MNALNQLRQLLLSRTISTEILALVSLVFINTLWGSRTDVQTFWRFLQFGLSDVIAYSGEMTAGRTADIVNQNSWQHYTEEKQSMYTEQHENRKVLGTLGDK